MQTNAATGPHCPDGSSLSSALASLGYSDLVDRHVMAGFPSPPPFGDDMISLGRGQMGCSRAGDEFWSTPSASYTSPYPFESPKTGVDSTFEGTNCSFEGLHFDGSTRWDFNRGVVLSPELQESSIMMNEWMLSNPGPSRFSKELSLSLATSHPRVVEQGGGSELSSSGVSSYSSLHKRHVGSDNTSCSSSNLSLNFSSCKAAIPGATLLSGSRFFQAMQEILAEFACYALENCERTSFSDHHRHGLESSSHTSNNSNISFAMEAEIESKKKHLMSLLQVVDDQYNRCLDEIHTVVSAFHAVTELDPNLHARFALPTISAMYRNLRVRISSHILAMGAAQHVEEEMREEDRSFETSFIQKQWALQQLKKRDHQLWRPQRGLPERSVSVLRAWMFQNFLHPYPKDAEKHLLALKSGLTRSQVSNWFINARVRLWKPMIEEMYAEMNRRKAPRNQEEANGSHRNLLRFESRRFTVD